jgi:hypothetical protein
MPATLENPQQGPGRAASDSSERIGQIRSKVREERALLSEVEQKITDDELKKALLGPASMRLEQVEQFFLHQQTLDKPRSEAALSKWLEGAERELAAAIKCRAQAEEAIRKWGP